ncbi:hypothetical protein NBG4_240033 [Candidatus Sulfobium mesophilum]|uniref:Uncharacterized protein n=1 Tax=Candidatus Sulfobium mesophilum TaxID=2016548 RepID=A0A2U3QGI9_9BACT|nr:hypothetical protein NBG4_240033 [Candidatus Sulfobium mesophilum]
MPPLPAHGSIANLGHFYFAYLGHYHFGVTVVNCWSVNVVVRQNFFLDVTGEFFAGKVFSSSRSLQCELHKQVQTHTDLAY